MVSDEIVCGLGPGNRRQFPDESDTKEHCRNGGFIVPVKPGTFSYSYYVNNIGLFIYN